MITLRKRVIMDDRGRQVGVLIDMAEYKRLLTELEELESIRAYDAAKAAKGKAIPFERAVRQIERNR
jgi:PHD/YefM family antitoxin component YafN of YafNO toxin-antitoxin module